MLRARYARGPKTGYSWPSVLGPLRMMGAVMKRTGVSMGLMEPTQGTTPFQFDRKKMWNYARRRPPGMYTYAQSHDELEKIHALLQDVDDPSNAPSFPGFDGQEWRPSPRAVDLNSPTCVRLGEEPAPSLSTLVQANIRKLNDMRAAATVWAAIYHECGRAAVGTRHAADQIQHAFDGMDSGPMLQAAIEALDEPPQDTEVTPREQQLMQLWKQPTVRPGGGGTGLELAITGLLKIAHDGELAPSYDRIACYISGAQMTKMGPTRARTTLVAEFRYRCLVFPDTRVRELAERAAADMDLASEEERALSDVAAEDARSSAPITVAEWASDELAIDEGADGEDDEGVDGEDDE